MAHLMSAISTDPTTVLSRPAVRVVASLTVVLSLVARFLRAAGRIVVIPRRFRFLSRFRIHVLSAKPFPALPAPGPTAASSNHESAATLKAAGEDVITGLVFQTPALAPGALLRIVGHPYIVASLGRGAAAASPPSAPNRTPNAASNSRTRTARVPNANSESAPIHS